MLWNFERLVYESYIEIKGDCMKKMIVFVLTLVCVLGVVGCGNRVAVNSEVDVSMVGDQLPKGLIPIVLVNV